MKIMYLYYNQLEAVERLKALGYDKCGIDIIFIDDGSKIPLECDWATVYRIDKDIAWNQPQANNYGFSKILNETVLRLDIDHYFSINNLMKINAIKLRKNEVIRFNRLYKGKRIKPNKNIYLANVNDIVNIGGYNEVFCGNYGYDDTELVDRMNRNKFKFTTSKILCLVDSDSSTKGLNRNTEINYNKYQKTINESNLYCNNGRL